MSPQVSILWLNINTACMDGLNAVPTAVPSRPRDIIGSDGAIHQLDGLSFA
jgi:hypothetical protein